MDPRSATACPNWRSPRAVEDLARGLPDGVPRQRLGVGTLELLREVGQQALADQLQQDVVVALEGHVDVEVLTEAHEAVLEHEPRAAARLTALLQRVEGVPGRQRLEGGRQRLQVLAVVRGGVGAAGEDAVELLQELVVREQLRVRGRQPRQQSALVLAVVEQRGLLAADAVELAALGA